MAGITDLSFRSETGTIGTGSRSSPGWFDARYYLAKNPDVARQLSDLPGFEKYSAALRHFMDFGAKELRNPNALFDMKAYLEANPDVAASGANPFLHYKTHGRIEGREAIAVQDGTRPSRAIHGDGGPLGLSDLPGLSQGGMAFQVDAGSMGAAGTAAPVGSDGIWSHGLSLMSQPGAVGGGAGLAAASPQPEGQGVTLLAGIGSILPGMQAPHEVRLLTAV